MGDKWDWDCKHEWDGYEWCGADLFNDWSDEDELRWNEDQLMEEYDNEEDDSVVEGEWWTRFEGARPRANEPTFLDRA